MEVCSASSRTSFITSSDKPKRNRFVDGNLKNDGKALEKIISRNKCPRAI